MSHFPVSVAITISIFVLDLKAYKCSVQYSSHKPHVDFYIKMKINEICQKVLLSSAGF